MFKAFEYRLYPCDDQKVLLNKHFGTTRWFWNWALEKKIEHYKQTKKTLSRYDIQKYLPGLKKSEDTKWLKEVNSQALQAILPHLDVAYKRFFDKKAKFPNFKSRKNKQSFEIPQNLEVDFAANLITLPKFKKGIKCIFHRKFTGAIRTCHIKCTKAGSYYVSILVDDKIKAPKVPEPERNKSIGIDLGLKHFAITSKGVKIENPRFLGSSLKQLRKLSKSFSRKLKVHKKGEPLGNNAEKDKKKLAQLHERVRNQRKDFLHKTSTKLIRENQTICIEDLAIQDMVKNKRLARHITDVGWGTFRSMLTYKSKWYGKNLLTIGRFDPSSKTCSKCGWIKRDLTLKNREFVCESCGLVLDRDVNAALNIKDFAFVGLRNQSESTPVKHEASQETQSRKSVERSHSQEAPRSLAAG